MAHVHQWSMQSYEEKYYPPHSGEWGGMQHGHQCCGQCKAPAEINLLITTVRIGDGRCHGACNGVCNIPKSRTAVRAICATCGTIGAKSND